MERRLQSNHSENLPGFQRFTRDEIEQSIAARFAKVASAFPERPAVSALGVTWTYAELDRRSSRIASAILRRRPDVPEAVALMLPNVPDLASAILGVLRAGKYYLGLEPRAQRALPKEILRDAGAGLIITSSEFLEDAQALAGCDADVMALESVGDDVRSPPASLPSASPDDLAYIFYTSGTTGRPKGVADNQRNVLHNVMRYTNALEIAPADRMSLLQSASFSGSVSSLFGALLNGACSCPCDPRGKTAAQLADWLHREQITIYHSVPSIFRHALSSGEAFPVIRIVRLEGDQAMASDLALFASRFGPDTRLANGLGTTETGLVSQFFASTETRLSTPVVPVGYAVEDIETLVVDDAGEPLPAGSVGEIAVKSRYLAVGYWRNPSLTAQRFVPDARDPLLRTYLTGDLGRMHEDGCLEHLGRKDMRVKVHGQSIELIDVEGALQSLTSVSEAAAAVHTDAAGRQILVAYYVPAAPLGPTVSELRRELRGTLPPHMMPAAYVELPALPRNENGKLDRAALPSPGSERPRLETAYLHPRSMLEYQLKTIWERVLGISPIGVRDDFFDVGGDSLAAMAMASLVQDELGAALTPEQLLGNATIEGIANCIREGTANAPVPLVELQPGDGGPSFFYLHGDYVSGGYYARKLARAVGADVRFIAVTPCGADGVPPPETFEEMAMIHLRHLREVQPHGPYFLGGTCNGGLIAYEMARRLTELGEHVALLALFAASSGNARLSGLARIAHVLASALGYSPRQERALFVRLREMALNFRGLTPLAAVRHAMRKSRRVPHEIRNLFRRNMKPATTGAWDIRDHYLFAEYCFIPGRYPGRLLLLWPEGEPDSAQEIASWWRRVAPAVEMKCLPSTHHACLTADAHLLGGALADAIAAARANPATDPADPRQSA